jgi:hypothetical protein
MAPEPGTRAGSSGAREFWLRRIRLLQWRVNAAWWLDMLQPILFAAALTFVAVVLVGRRAGWENATLLYVLIVLLVLAAALALIRAWPRFLSVASARAELEARLGLHSRLSAAYAGVGEWPARPEERRAVWRWSWRRLAAVPALALILGFAAWHIPIAEVEARRVTPALKPPALAAVEEWITHLEQIPALDQASLQEVKEQAGQLAGQDPAEWYSHASLEAADHLQQQLKEGLQALDRNASVMQSLVGTEQQLSQKDAERWKEQLDAALGALSGNVPALQRVLGQQLRELDASKLRSLTPEQLQQLQKLLAEARNAAKDLLPGFEPGDGEGEDGEDDVGNGSLNRGPGHAPMKYAKTPTDLATTKTEGVESEDFTRASLGDLGAVSEGQHQLDKERKYRAASGGAAQAGAGPDAVWIQQALRPEERKRLREFYQ